MVIVQLSGGLGNQLFQYAAGRAIALTTQSALKLDLSNCADGAYRPYRLGLFHIAAQLADRSEVPFEFRQTYRPSIVRKAYRKLPGRLQPRRSGPRVIRETSFAFDESVMYAGEDVYLVGYWQSPKYFADAEDVIRSDLVLTPAEAGVGTSLASDVRRQGTVSVHVRRGDYVTSLETSAFHGVCSAQYYADALELLSAHAEVRTVYVVSDDIEWARTELRFATPTVFVNDPGDGSDIRDFFLMSQCEHHIIANSSFSWWAAWLGRHPDGIVVSPRQWFTDATIDTSDLRPADWLMV